VKQLKDQLYDAFIVHTAPRDRNESPAPYSAPPVLTSIEFVDKELGWAAGYTGTCIRTLDAGRTWTEFSSDLKANIEGIHFFSANDGWAIANWQGRALILKTENGGMNWRAHTQANGWLKGMSFVDRQYGWVCGQLMKDEGVEGAAVFQTQDSGRTWDLQYFNQKFKSGIVGIQFLDASNGWAITQDTILRSQDGGKTWKQQYSRPGSILQAINIVTPSQGWVVGNAGLLLHTDDGGNSWAEITSYVESPSHSPPWLTCVEFLNREQGWIGGTDGRVFSTKDGGKSWRQETLGVAGTVTNIALNSSSIFAVTSRGTVLKRSR
jgi:photosystem II stability/assembly factor-like uncharacterized protein